MQHFFPFFMCVCARGCNELCFPSVKATGPKGALKDEAKGSVQKSQRLWNEAKNLENVVKGKKEKTKLPVPQNMERSGN